MGSTSLSQCCAAGQYQPCYLSVSSLFSPRRCPSTLFLTAFCFIGLCDGVFKGRSGGGQLSNGTGSRSVISAGCCCFMLTSLSPLLLPCPSASPFLSSLLTFTRPYCRCSCSRTLLLGEGLDWIDVPNDGPSVYRDWLLPPAVYRESWFLDQNCGWTAPHDLDVILCCGPIKLDGSIAPYQKNFVIFRLSINVHCPLY